MSRSTIKSSNQIGFLIQIKSTEPKTTQRAGTCWHSLFKGLNIASGFPILARTNNEKGLEIPLDMMAALGGADRATIFNDQLVIKGFSTIFAPTERRKGSILWHFLCNENNVRIPYFAAENLCPTRVKIDELNYPDLEPSRHFLGWSSSTQLQTGTANIDYRALQYTGSNFSTPGCALEKVTISAGKLINVGGTFALGANSRFILGSPEPYILKMHAASQMHVIMYDTDDRRAWLIDGANALLHLTRAQLAQRPYCNSNLLNLQQFSYANPREGADAALKALSIIESTNPPIFEEQTTIDERTVAKPRWGLKDMVLNLWHILEQMQDHQTQMTNPGMPLRFTDRDKLEGFGFLDIISGKTNIRPRVATLKSSGRGWVDLTREIQAVTLMARGFGDLIVPTNYSNYLCTKWTEVPSSYDYLVARISQLRDICEQNGDMGAQPLELARGLYWHQSSNLFHACKLNTCSGGCDHVQVLLPKAKLRIQNSPNPLNTLDGAVIFGRSDRLSKWWPRNPRIGPQDSEALCELEDSRRVVETSSYASLNDSGLGSGISNAGESSDSSGRFSPDETGSTTELPAATRAQEAGISREIIPSNNPLSSQSTDSPSISRKGKEVARRPVLNSSHATVGSIQSHNTSSPASPSSNAPVPRIWTMGNNFFRRPSGGDKDK